MELRHLRYFRASAHCTTAAVTADPSTRARTRSGSADPHRQRPTMLDEPMQGALQSARTRLPRTTHPKPKVTVRQRVTPIRRMERSTTEALGKGTNREPSLAVRNGCAGVWWFGAGRGYCRCQLGPLSVVPRG